MLIHQYINVMLGLKVNKHCLSNVVMGKIELISNLFKNNIFSKLITKFLLLFMYKFLHTPITVSS